MSLDKRHLWSSEEIEAFERWEMPDLTGVSLRSLGREKISDEIVDPEELAEENAEEEILLPTVEEVEAIRKEAYDTAFAEGLEKGRLDGYEQGREDGFLKGKAEGYEEGSQQGYADGLQQGEREVNDNLSRLNGMLSLLHEPIAAQHEELESVLYDLVTHLVSLMTHKELSIDSSVVTQIIQDSLAALPRNSDRIRVFVNPEDYELSHQQASRQIDPWQVFSDESVSRGGCRVETISSLIDSRVESRLEDLLQQVVTDRYAGSGKEISAVNGASVESPKASNTASEIDNRAPADSAASSEMDSDSSSDSSPDTGDVQSASE